MSFLYVNHSCQQGSTTIKHDDQASASALGSSGSHDSWLESYFYIYKWRMKCKIKTYWKSISFPIQKLFLQTWRYIIHILCQTRFHNVKSISSKFTSFVFTESSNIKNRLQKLFLANWLVKRLILLLDNGVISCKACFQVVWQLSPLFL